MAMTKDQARNMLGEIKEISMEASLTHSLKGGYGYSMKMYNNIRNIAIKEEWIDADLIEELDEENCNNVDVVATAAALFMAVLKN